MTEGPEVGRAFVGVRPPDNVLDAVSAAAVAGRGAGEGLRWPGPDTWHLTLQFLGPVVHLAPVVDGLASATATSAPFLFRLGGAGAFPTARGARVVWIGAAEGGDRLAALAGAVAGLLWPLGYEPERGPFRPHLTVARRREPGDVGPVLAALGTGPVGPAFPVEEVVLYESRLSPAGSSYTVLERFPLRGP